MLTLAEVTTFGGIDADADALLDECFQDHEAYLEAVGHRKPFVLGRKGSGKTAIFRKIIRTRAHTFFAYGHTFSDYPWQHHQAQHLIGVPEESRYVQSWQYLILLTVAKILLNQDHSQPWDERAFEQLKRLESFVVDSYGTRDPDVTQLFTPSKRLRVRPHLKLAKEWLDLGLDLERLPVTELPRVVQEVNANITEAVIESLNPEFDYFVCFDELDRGFDPSSKVYLDMLVGLLLASKLINDRARAAGKRLSVVVFLRDDIYHVLRFEDKNKVTEALASSIEWDASDGRWTLEQLMERRFSKVLGNGASISWNAVFDEDHEMPGRQAKYRHILDRTFNRPRDIIKFCNEVLDQFKARHGAESKFTNKDVISARASYSDYLLRELEDEIHKHLPHHAEYLELLRAVGAAMFTKEDFEAACTRRADLLPEDDKPSDVLRRLFEFSVVAYQKTGGIGGGSEYVWRYLNPRARFDEAASNFRVHPGLIEGLGLKRYSIKKFDAAEVVDEMDASA